MSPYTSSSAVAPSARWRRPNCRLSRPGTSRPHAPPQDQLATRSWEHQRRRSARCSINVGVLPRPVSSTRWNQPANGSCATVGGGAEAQGWRQMRGQEEPVGVAGRGREQSLGRPSSCSKGPSGSCSASVSSSQTSSTSIRIPVWKLFGGASDTVTTDITIPIVAPNEAAQLAAK
ncbi:uncharacterized protein LOC120663068 [Panicum virgatum]|uniref:uncharacterized protein LOC120663068 n=1 Tax=Panicum virgatum TaxID=38727 RepID=UPI0019D553C7|nr:uncharacterized protein LOC120663068 [Panicum virgatum]